MDIPEAIAEIQQSRSRFQLEHFVLGQHDTPEMRFYQLCIELQDMEFKLAHATIQIDKAQLEIVRLRRKRRWFRRDPIAQREADLAELGLQQTRLAMIGAEREVRCLREMFDAHPKFTRADIEQAQPDYWRARLTRQTSLQIMSGGVGWAQLEAMRQIGELEPMLEQQQLSE